jgi:hypothetical protein
MKENRSQRLERILRSYGGRATLGQILSEIREDGGLVYKFTAACSELREDLKLRNQTVVCHKGPTPSQNTYAIEPLLELWRAA